METGHLSAMARIIYICYFTSLCGGRKIIAEHVARLARRGHAAEWWGIKETPSWFQVPYRQFRDPNAIGAALQQERSACIVATWWQTAFLIPPNLRGQSRGFYLIQDLDQLVYSSDDSGSSYKLGLTPITEGAWVTEELRRLFGLRPAFVGMGLAHRIFYPDNIERDYDCVFASYRPMSGRDDLKGFETIKEVMKLVCRENPSASLVTFGNQGTPRDLPFPHMHLNQVPDETLRMMYSRAGTFLQASKREGFGLPPLEAMACGLPVVTTDTGGGREFCIDEQTALLGHSPVSLASQILRLQRNRDDWNRFSAAGLVRASEYRWPPVIDKLENLFNSELHF